MTIPSKIGLLIGFFSGVCAYSLYPYLWYDSFYDLVALSFVGYTGALYFQTKGEWSIVCLVVWLTTINSFIEEIFFNPLDIEYNEFTSFTLIVLIVCRFKKKWMR